MRLAGTTGLPYSAIISVRLLTPHKPQTERLLCPRSFPFRRAIVPAFVISQTALKRPLRQIQCAVLLWFGNYPRLLTATGCRGFWSEYKDSNLGPPGPKPGALPDCATLRILVEVKGIEPLTLTV
jgi:hypothetical protein